MDTSLENERFKLVNKFEENPFVSVFWLFAGMILEFTITYLVLTFYYNSSYYKQSNRDLGDDDNSYIYTPPVFNQSISIQIEDRCSFCTYTANCQCCRGTYCTPNTSRYQ